SPTYEQAHVGLDLLTLASRKYCIYYLMEHLSSSIAIRLFISYWNFVFVGRNCSGMRENFLI
ncbi:hypothetical protein, partial [[Ruminococcus] lactaris]|uniref:hypothetical protein n=1 Tax=[Ruminococcus] lactaris TaxID=46228 RepID=UPI001D040E3D